MRRLICSQQRKANSRVSGRSKAVEVERKVVERRGLPFICHGGNRMTDSGLRIASGDRKAW